MPMLWMLVAAAAMAALPCHAADIAPYMRALAAYGYQVEEVTRGTLKEKVSHRR